MVQPTTKRLVTEASVGGHVLTQLTSPGATKDALGNEISTQLTTPGTPASTALAANYGPTSAPMTSVFASNLRARLGVRFAFIGDSTTIGAQSSGGSSPGEVPLKTPISGASGAIGHSWPSDVEMLSGGRVRNVRNAGVDGNTSAQMLARFDADVTPYAPQVVHICSGINDAGTGVTTATYKANMVALVAKVRAIGAVPTMQTITPTPAGTTLRALMTSWNQWLIRYAEANAIPLVDFCTEAMDPITGLLKVSYDSGDGVHPNATGRRALANRYLTDLDKILPAARPSTLATWNADTTNIITNGMFVGDANADGIADNWVLYAGGGGAVFSLQTGQPFRGGTAQRITLSAAVGDRLISQYRTTGFAPGDVLQLSVAVSSTGTAQAQMKTEFRTSGYALVGTTQRYAELPVTNGLLELTVTVPPTSTTMEFTLGSKGDATGTIDFGNVTVRNLTTLAAVV